MYTYTVLCVCACVCVCVRVTQDLLEAEVNALNHALCRVASKEHRATRAHVEQEREFSVGQILHLVHIHLVKSAQEPRPAWRLQRLMDREKTIAVVPQALVGVDMLHSFKRFKCRAPLQLHPNVSCSNVSHATFEQEVWRKCARLLSLESLANLPVLDAHGPLQDQ